MGRGAGLAHDHPSGGVPDVLQPLRPGTPCRCGPFPGAISPVLYTGLFCGRHLDNTGLGDHIRKCRAGQENRLMKYRKSPFTSGKGESKRAAMAGACIFLSAFLISTSVDASTIYRWVGGGGVVSYGEAPPPGAKGVEQISGAPQASVSTPMPGSGVAGATSTPEPPVPAPA
ncbi:DUF4124 domain-containing protein, partial [Acidithiobacillus sp. PG05]|uniref:DUF4124 domain-containing protein n=1 Tax=Acidithiobacillus sp. PG05 TaxID=2801581 RepID=UPI003216CB92